MASLLSFYKKGKATRRLSLFEKVILVNTLLLIGEALAGLWITSHNLESHHYLIDTSFIVAATLLSLLINFLLLHASFRPMFHLLRVIRAVAEGDLTRRAENLPADTEIGELALAFNSMLDQLEASQRQQTLLIFQAQEEERRRVARELHDESSQDLTALLVHAEIMSQILQTLPDTASIADVRATIEAGLCQLTQLTQNTLEHVRTLALQLRPGILDDLGLHAALRWLVEDARQRLQLPIELSIDGLEEVVRAHSSAALYATTLFRIAQESLTNAARHARAQHISITSTQGAQQVCLTIRDDGIGYDSTTRSPGLGITGMRERAALLSGKLTITTTPGKGTSVEARLPLQPPVSVPVEERAYA
jgi:two-component system sensor histidine kinase UhpB